MLCFTPIAIKTNKLLNPVYVPCGTCLACLRNKQKEWTFRLNQEWKSSINSVFLTLTYNQDSVPSTKEGTLSLYKPDLQRYFKRVRHDSNNDLKYYAIGEYCPTTGRPHYHALVFNADKHLLQVKWSKYDRKNKNYKALGFTTAEPITQARINYCTGYLVNGTPKGYFKHIRQKEFSLMSKSLGISYVDMNKKYHQQSWELTVTNPGGEKQVMPRYYQDKIFDQEDELKLIKYWRNIEVQTSLKKQYDVNTQASKNKRAKHELTKHKKFRQL